MNTPDQGYESIGVGYAAARRPDPRIRHQLVDALLGAQSTLNVGAGNYELTDRRVVAAGPSSAVKSQRDSRVSPQGREWREPCQSVMGPLMPRW